MYIVPEKYRVYFNFAIKKLPQLKDVDIEVIEGKEYTTMACRPDIWKLLIWKRKYNIHVSLPWSTFLTFDQLPEKAKYGIFAHELCHAVDYESCWIRWFINLWISYLTKKGKQKLEEKVDKLTIELGFWRELLELVTFQMISWPAPEKYKKFKKDHYLNPHDIERLVLEYEKKQKENMT